MDERWQCDWRNFATGILYNKMGDRRRGTRTPHRFLDHHPLRVSSETLDPIASLLDQPSLSGWRSGCTDGTKMCTCNDEFAVKVQDSNQINPCESEQFGVPHNGTSLCTFNFGRGVGTYCHLVTSSNTTRPIRIMKKINSLSTDASVGRGGSGCRWWRQLWWW